MAALDGLTPAIIGAANAAGGSHQVDRSLRFHSSDTSYLNRTPSSATNRRTYTFSCWVKRSELTSENNIFHANSSSWFRFESSQKIYFWYDGSNSVYTDTVFRDASAWYHLVLVVDTTQTTASDRVKIYVNGVQQTLSGTQPTQNFDTGFNNNIAHYIGSQGASSSNALNGYLAETHFVDGTALAATDFGEYDDNNVWNPKEYSGSYGTNGFYLKFADNSSNAALGTDSSGNGNTWTVNNLVASVETANTSQTWSSNQTGYFSSNAANAFDGNLATSAFANSGASANAYVDITTINASKVEVYISAYGSGSAGAYYYCRQTDGTQHTYTISSSGTSLGWITVYDGSQIEINRLGGARNSSGAAGSAQYAWRVDDVLLVNAGTAGFDPLMIDSLIDTPTNYDADSGNNGGNYPSWNPLDNGGALVLSDGNLEAEDTNNDSHRACRATQRIPNSDKFYFECTITAFSNTFAFGISTSTAVDPELATSGSRYLLVNTGGNVQRYDGGSYTEFSGQSGLGNGASFGSVLQVAIDQDAGKLWFGLNNVWLGTTTAAAGDPSNGTNPTLTGTYTNAFPVINCVNTAGAVNFGQREFKYTAPTNFKSLCTQNSTDPSIADGSTGMNSTLYTGDGSARNISTPYGPDFVWIKSRNATYDHGLFDVIRGANQRINSNSNGSEGTEANSVTAFNSDSFSLGTLAFYNNPSTTFVAWNWDAGTSNATISAGSLNDSSTYNQSQVWSNFYSSTSGFEQNSAGNAFDPNTDNTAASASYGDTQSLVLSTGVTYTSQIRAKTHYTSGTAYINGDSSSAVSVGSGWITVKTGSGTMNRIDFTSSGQRCYVSAIEVDGKILLDPIPAITSTVRANPSYGFSIVKYTGDGKNTANVGHGLNAAPELVLCKDLDDTDNWQVYHANAQTSGAQLLKLNNTDAVVANNGAWNNQTPTSSIVITGGGGTNDSGSADGPFVFTGFSPSWLLIKNIDNYGGLYSWWMFDSSRDQFNPVNRTLNADTNGDDSSQGWLDFLSNGFKIRASSNAVNLNAHTHIWAAFAEHPFKTTRAR